jgi:predicted NBD/HSP70 family sugar kinase
MSYWLNYEGSMVIDVDGSILDAHFIDKDGNVRDHFRIEKPLPEPAAVIQLLAGGIALTLLSKRRARCGRKPVSIVGEVAGCRTIRSARSADSSA